MALRVSCLIHAMLVLLLGCAAHRPIVLSGLGDADRAAGNDFVGAVADKMPMWDADGISRYERVQIAIVKADIAMARQSEETAAFLDYVSKLRADWDALVAWDEMLKKESLT
jgi:hypothetical protein